jgi:uncharacterized ion transporter superfamily protein YfcC
MAKRKKESMHMFIMLTIVILVCTVLTYLVPAGAYDRVTDAATGRSIVNADSFHYIARTPVSLIQFLSSIPNGFAEVSDIIFITLAGGGAFAIIQKAGLFNALIAFILKKFKNRGILAIPVLTLVFAILDTCLGMPELCVLYIPAVLPLVIGLGFDTITATSVVVCGSCSGFAAGILNPYTTVVAQKLTGLPIYSGMGFRFCELIVFYCITAAYIVHHAVNVHKNPKLSPTYELDQKHRAEISTDMDATLTPGKKIAAVYALGLFAFMIFGIIQFGWDLPQMSGMMIAIGFGVALLAGYTPNEACREFSAGARDVLDAALLVAIARGVSVVLTEGNIIDTVVHAASMLISGLSPTFLAIGIFILATILNFFIPSGSGKATVIVPILSPLAQICGINQQTMIIAYQFGDGFSNSIFPTAGFYMAAIQLTGISYPKWLKHQLPLYAMWFVAGCVFLLIAQTISLGPF